MSVFFVRVLGIYVSPKCTGIHGLFNVCQCGGVYLFKDKAVRFGQRLAFIIQFHCRFFLFGVCSNEYRRGTADVRFNRLDGYRRFLFAQCPYFLRKDYELYHAVSNRLYASLDSGELLAPGRQDFVPLTLTNAFFLLLSMQYFGGLDFVMIVPFPLK